MKTLKMAYLENCFAAAKEKGANYIALKISINKGDKAEVIINSKENFDTKLAYLKAAYNEDLCLKTTNAIQIVGFTYANSFEDIEKDLYGEEE